MPSKTISGWIEFNEKDLNQIQAIFGSHITEIRKTDYPTHKAARFENAPETTLDTLTDLWGLFEWKLDNQESPHGQSINP